MAKTTTIQKKGDTNINKKGKESNTASIKKDEELAALLTTQTEEELKLLKECILAEGCRESIKVWNGIIVDGHARYDICKKHDIAFKTEEMTFKSRDDAKAWIIKSHLARRNLSSYDRCVLALKLEEIIRQKAKANQRLARGKGVKGAQVSVKEKVNTYEELAKIAGVSHDTLRKARLIATNANDRHKKLLSQGRATINSIHNELKVDADRKKLREPFIPSGKFPVSGKDYQLLLGDMNTVCNKLEDGSIDGMVTDPPYYEIECYEMLARQAARLLKDGGSLMAMIGTEFLPDVLKVMTPHLNYHWTLAYMMPRTWTQKLKKRVPSFYKMVLWFTKGTYRGDWVSDVVQSGKREKDFDNWQQDVLGTGELIRRVSTEGDMIMDPFLGSGTTGIAALKLGRRFIGIEKRNDKFELSKERIHKALYEESAANDETASESKKKAA